MLKELDAASSPRAAAVVQGARPNEAAVRDEETLYFDEVGVGRALTHESRDEAVARAKQDALAKAARGGADVFYGFSDYSSQLGKERYESVARYIFASNRGVLLEESVDQPECELVDSVTVCRVRVRGNIVFKGRIDPAFKLVGGSSDVPLGLDRSQYFDGEPIRMHFGVSKDSFLYIFSWDSQDSIFLVFPNWLHKDNKFKAGQSVRFPEEGSGIAYKAVLPKGRTSAAERLLVLASKREIAVPDASAAERAQGYAVLSMGKMVDVLKQLAVLDRDEWIFQVFPYEIRSKPAGDR